MNLIINMNTDNNANTHAHMNIIANTINHESNIKNINKL